MGRGYDVKVREGVKEMYKGGTRRSLIVKITGIPLSTIYSWTKDVFSPSLVLIQCEACDKKIRTLNINQKYCSPSCKKHAYYLRRKQRNPLLKVLKFVCEHCGQAYQPAHGNAKKYCSEECRKAAANQRRQNHREVEADQLERATFESALDRLRQARRDALNMRIDSTKHSGDIDIVTEYFNKYRGTASVPHELLNEIQDLIKMVK